MSNVIPPLLSNTPPPPPSPEEDDDDEFGDFTGANYLSYGCDNLSLPPSPVHSPKKVSISNGLDINSNDEKNKVAQIDLDIEKDFQDKRKYNESLTNFSMQIEENRVDVEKDNVEHPVIDHFHIELKSPKNNDNSENHTSISLIVDESIKNQSNQVCPPKDESKCNTDNGIENSLNQNNLPVQEIFSTKNVENDQNAGTSVDGHLEKFNSSPDTEKAITTENYVNKEMGLETDSLETKEPIGNVDVGDFSTLNEESNFENDKNENIENEFDNITSISEVESKEDNDEGIAEFYPQNRINGNSNCMKKNVFSFQMEDCQPSYIEDEVEAKDLKISTVLENEVKNKEDLDDNEEQSCTDDEFGDFAFANQTINSTIKSDQTVEEFGDSKFTDIKKVEDNERKVETELTPNDDFGDFSFPETSIHTSLSKTISDGSVSTEKEQTKNDGFDDFCEFTSTTIDLNQVSSTQDDEFCNFANFAEVQEPVILTLNEKQAFEKAECILTEIFPVPNDRQDDFHYINIEKDDFIFNELRDITETQALAYQWSKSASQNMLLKALNIDARNILYGPSWNPSIPRFAANLGLKPLEPIKTEILTPTVLKSSPSISTQPSNVEIPSAQFDWNGSGLINPLDSVSKNPTETSPQADTTQKSPELPADQVFTLKPTPISSKAEDFARAPTKSDLEQKIDPSDQQFDDFTSYQSTGELQPHTSWPSIVPLRETYISNENLTSNLNIKELPLDIEGWLQPTIVSPELPRKDLVIGEEELPNIQTPELTRKSVSGETIEDDFDEFQMVLPGNENTGSERTIITNNSDILQPIKPELILPQQALRNFEFPDLTSFEIEPVVKKSEGKPSKNDLEVDIAEENKQDTFDDDEFTDFHFSTPVSQPIISKPITPILEPLKPVPVYPIVTSTPSTQINWPDPGITEEEIKKFEMVFSRPKESKNEEPKKVKDETKKLSSANSIDDDEWSDFVSVQKPSPVHKFQLNERERTSSPDLPLSVLNLSSIQPAKQPIPVITPQGLVQTKLSSNSTITMSPKTHSKNNVLSMQNKHLYQQPQIQPSIISNQYASQAYNFNSGYYNQNTKAELNFSLNQQQKSLDEDDWSDFVSNPIPQTSANGYQQNWQNTSSHHQSGWTTAPPNIITNPGHFVQSGSDLKNRKVSNVSVNSKKSTIPSISLPELEFIGPKGRTSSSRKK